MKKAFKKSKGFSLVELLIVIIIISILAGMMMLSAGAATAKADATKIVANMRNMKMAAILIYADNTEWPTDIASLDKYLDQSVNTAVYKIESNCIELTPPANIDQKILDNLSRMATTGDINLYSPPSAGHPNGVKYTGTGKAYMPFD